MVSNSFTESGPALFRSTRSAEVQALERSYFFYFFFYKPDAVFQRNLTNGPLHKHRARGARRRGRVRRDATVYGFVDGASRKIILDRLANEALRDGSVTVYPWI